MMELYDVEDDNADAAARAGAGGTGKGAGAGRAGAVAGDGEAATCGVSEVFGLRADGDGFLAIRSGPGSHYRKIGELYNGNRVTVFGRQGDWVGIAVGGERLNHRCLRQ